MIFEPLYSSSKGNLYRVMTNSRKDQLIIDPGVSKWNTVLKAIDYQLSTVVGCLVTHKHKDHAAQIVNMFQSGIKIFAGQETLEDYALDGFDGVFPLRDLTRYMIGPFIVFAFSVVHDVPAFGFIITHGTDHLFFAVDCCNIEHKFGVAFTKVAICCSYDNTILDRHIEGQKVHEALARRLKHSHMEKYAALNYLKEKCNLIMCRDIWLLHMSHSNIDRHETRKEFQKILGQQNYGHLQVHIT